MAKRIVHIDDSENTGIMLETVEEIKPVKAEKKEHNVYKDALETVLKMIQSGTHVENVMKYIDSILK